MSASGTNRPGIQSEYRTDNDGIHSDAGGLSTVIELAMSEEPKNHAFHDCEPA